MCLHGLRGRRVLIFDIPDRPVSLGDDPATLLRGASRWESCPGTVIHVFPVLVADELLQLLPPEAIQLAATRRPAGVATEARGKVIEQRQELPRIVLADLVPGCPPQHRREGIAVLQSIARLPGLGEPRCVDKLVDMERLELHGLVAPQAPAVLEDLGLLHAQRADAERGAAGMLVTDEYHAGCRVPARPGQLVGADVADVRGADVALVAERVAEVPDHRGVSAGRVTEDGGKDLGPLLQVLVQRRRGRWRWRAAVGVQGVQVVQGGTAVARLRCEFRNDLVQHLSADLGRNNKRVVPHPVLDSKVASLELLPLCH